MKRHAALPAAALAAALLASGCGPDRAILGLSTRVAAPRAAASGLQIGDRVVLERVRMAIRDVKLEKHVDAAEVEVVTGPFLLDLSGPELDGGW